MSIRPLNNCWASVRARVVDHALEQVVDYLSLALDRLRQCLRAGQGFTDNEVTLVVENEPRSVEVSVIAVYDHQEQLALMELRKIDQQKRISQEQQQHAQQLAARDLVRGLAHEIKNPLGGLRGAAQLLEKALPDEQLKEYTGIIIAQADRLRNLVDRLLGPQRPGTASGTQRALGAGASAPPSRNGITARYSDCARL